MIYEFLPPAEAEFYETILFYDSRRPGLGSRFYSEFVRLMENICLAPRLYPIVKQPNVRKAILRRFPYCIFFQERTESILVVSVAHQRRRPDYWFKRL